MWVLGIFHCLLAVTLSDFSNAPKCFGSMGLPTLCPDPREN